MSIPIAASGSSKAIDDNNNDDSGDNSDKGKIAAVLKVLVAELEQKKETKAGVKRSFAEFHRNSADYILIRVFKLK